MPDPALAAAQRYCGWHVHPEETTEAVLDGPGGVLLSLPTLNLVKVLSVKEDGQTVDVADLEVSRNGMVRKKSGLPWTSALGGVVVKFAHGYEEADDFNQAVAMIDATLTSSIRDDAALTSKKVADVEYQWSVTLSGIAPAAQLLDKYKLPGLP